MRVFVTGISSDMGRKIAGHFVERGDDVVGLTREKDFRIDCVQIITGDLERPSTYGAHLAGVNLVVHVAGITHSDTNDQYFRLNTDAGRKLIYVAEACGVNRFIFISTRAIGPGCGAYGVSKRMLEQSLQASGLDWIILRVAEVYDVTKNEGINVLMAQVLGKKVIPIPGNGEDLLSPVHVDDVVAAVSAIAATSGIQNKIYTLCGPKTYSIKGFIGMMCQILHVNRVGVMIPFFLIRVVMGLNCIFKLSFHLTRDQLQRLTVAKDADFSEAEHDFGFSPSNFETWFRNKMKKSPNTGTQKLEKGRVKSLPGLVLFKGSTGCG